MSEGIGAQLGIGVNVDGEDRIIGTGFEDEWVMKENRDYVVRVVAGPEQRITVFYPSVGEDDDGTLKARMSAITVGSVSEGIIARLLKFQGWLKRKLIESGMPEEDIPSPFQIQRRSVYLILDRDAEEQPSVRVAVMPISVTKELRRIRLLRNPRDKNFALYGPPVLWDAIITRGPKSGATTRTAFSIEYRVQPDPTFPFVGKIPYEVARTGVIPENFDWLKVFKQEEIDAIRDFVAERGYERASDFLRAYTKPMSEEEILAHLRAHTINLEGYVYHRGSKVKAFPDVDMAAEALQRLEVEYTMIAPPGDEQDVSRPVQKTKSLPESSNSGEEVPRDDIAALEKEVEELF